MRLAFSPADAAGIPELRPLVDVFLEDLAVPVRCLVDTGSLRTRLPLWPAETLGIDLDGAPAETIVVAGVRTRARRAHVTVTLADIGPLPSSVWFCDDWVASFGLLGQEDVLRLVRLTYSAAGEWFRLEREDALSH